jgi:signal transduction histidine kinase
MGPRRPLEVVVLLLVVLHGSAALLVRDRADASLISNLLQLVVCVFAMGAAVFAARRTHGSLRWFWWCVAVALLQWAFGQATFVYFENIRHQPVAISAVTGPVMALFVAPLWLGLILLRRRAPAYSNVGLILDGCQIALVVAATYLRLFYVPQRWSMTDEAELIGFVYDVRNVALLASICSLYADTRPGQLRTILRYFVIAFAIYAVGELYYFHFTPWGVIKSGRLLDLIWSVPLALITLAAVRTPEHVSDALPSETTDLGGTSRLIPLMLPMFAAFLALSLYDYAPVAAYLILFLTLGTYGGRILWEGYVRAGVEKRWHEERRKSADTVSLLEATLESTADGILVVDREMRVVQYNRRFAEMWGLPPELLQTRDDKSLLSAVLSKMKDPEAFLARVKELYADPSAESFDTVDLNDYRSFERLSRPQVLEGKIVGRVWSFRDVTQARRLEDQLRQSQKMEAVGTLAGGIAHDFNNLLTIIIGYTQLARTREPDNPALKGDLEQISRSSDQAAALTRQLLSFSRKQMVLPTVLNLNDCIHETLKMLRRIIGEDIRLDTELDPNLPPIEADPGQMDQVLMNLAVNARDAMAGGGVLGFRTRRSGDQVELHVSDTGAGIDEKVLPHIFEPFFTTKEMGRGTGLGLATVYAAVQQAHGNIRVESRVDEGTTFIITLPVTNRTANEPEAEPPPSEKRSGTILLVEDERDVCQLCTSILGERGYKLIPCSDPKVALDIVEREGSGLDMVLTDVIMPGMSGDELVRRIRSKIPTIKVLFISGYDKSSITSAREIAPLLTKPFTPAELINKVEQALGSLLLIHAMFCLDLIN